MKTIIGRRKWIIATAGLLLLSGIAVRATAHAQDEPATIQIEAQNVYLGCNSIVVQAPLGTAWSEFSLRFSDPATVTAIWKFNNDLQRYQALYFSDPDALTDRPPATTAFVQSMFVCVSADGSVG